VRLRMRGRGAGHAWARGGVRGSVGGLVVVQVMDPPGPMGPSSLVIYSI
jgi:hypothetical protein